MKVHGQFTSASKVSFQACNDGDLILTRLQSISYWLDNSTNWDDVLPSRKSIFAVPSCRVMCDQVTF